jgi:hypothetical protein
MKHNDSLLKHSKVSAPTRCTAMHDIPPISNTKVIMTETDQRQGGKTLSLMMLLGDN